MIYLIVGLALSSCDSEEETIRQNPAIGLPGADTWCKFNILIVGSDIPSDPTKAAEVEGIPEESAVKNLALIFFKGDRYEGSIYLPDGSLTQEVTSAGENKKYKLSATVEVTSGSKNIIAILNYTQEIQNTLNSFLVKGSTTVNQFSKYSLDTRSKSGSNLSAPLRINLTKDKNYANDNQGQLLNLSLMGFLPSSDPTIGDIVSNNGLLMTGVLENIVLKPNVNAQKASTDPSNNLSLSINRSIAKVSVKLKPSLTYPVQIGNPVIAKVSGAEWWLANIPAESYLIKNDDTYHPYYSHNPAANDFSLWQNIYTSPVTLDVTERSKYIPENILFKPARGNATYIAVKAQLKPSSVNVENYDSNTKVWTRTVNDAPTIADGQTIYMIQEDDSRMYYLNSKDILNYTASYIGRTYGQSFPAEGQMRMVDIYSDPKYKKNLPADQAETDYVNTLQIDADKALDTMPVVPWYIFHQKSADGHNGTWYDEVRVFRFIETSPGSKVWGKEGKSFTFRYAVYTNGYCYYRLDIEDKTEDILSPWRYALQRNNWFNAIINSFKDIGYPDEQDLAINSSNELSDSWIEVKINVRDWIDGGKQDIEIGD